MGNPRGNPRPITLNGVTKNVKEWAETLGIHETTMHRRFKTMSVEQALSLPAYGIHAVRKSQNRPCNTCHQPKAPTDFYKGHARCKDCYKTKVRKAQQEKDPCIIRAWKRRYNRSHPQEMARNTSKYRTLKSALPYTFTLAEEAFCRAYFNYACACCGNEEGFLWTIAMDHFIPVTSLQCPGTIATNMIPLCHGVGGCNNTKNNKDPEQWLVQHLGKRRAHQVLQKIYGYFAIVSMQQQAS